MRMKVSVTACMDANGVLPKVVHRCAAGQFDAVSVYVMQTIPLLSSSMVSNSRRSPFSPFSSFLNIWRFDECFLPFSVGLLV